MTTFYQNLRIPLRATQEEISEAYAHLLVIHHPKKYPKEFLPRQIRINKIIEEAHRVLSNPRLREQYDMWLIKQGKYNDQNKATGQETKLYEQETIDFEFEEIKWSPYSTAQVFGVIGGSLAIFITSNLIGFGINHLSSTQATSDIDEITRNLNVPTHRTMSLEERAFERDFNANTEYPIKIDEITTVVEVYAKGYNVVVRSEISKVVKVNKNTLRKMIKQSFVSSGGCDAMLMFKNKPITFDYVYAYPNGTGFDATFTLKEMCDWR